MQVRRDRELELDADDLAGWLEAEPDRFDGVHIVRAEAAPTLDDDGEPAIEVTLVLSDPQAPEQTWPVESASAIFRAVDEHAAGLRESPRTFVQFRAASSDHAA